ncbi:TIGR04283 family arsenosugar biosynthesis glycosyltransferase [Ekhidna sp.]
MISIVIPTLNEEGFIKSTIQQTLDNAFEREILEIIVVDAGSSDGTLDIVNELGILSFSKPEFALKKFMSLDFGLSESSGDIVVFLDADTILPKDFDLLIRKMLSKKNVIAGAFEFSFLNPDLKLMILTLINGVRYRITKTYYGDQAIFARKEALKSIGGIPKEPLMEAAYLCRALKRKGRLALIKEPIKTSSRRFTEYGFFRVTWFDINMFFRFNLGLPVSKYAEKYWSKNLTN